MHTSERFPLWFDNGIYVVRLIHLGLDEKVMLIQDVLHPQSPFLKKLTFLEITMSITFL